MVGRSPEGRHIVAGEKIPITIQDAIAHNGPRVPAVTLRSRQPGAAMLGQLEGIGAAWVSYWSRVTSGVFTMSLSTGRTP